MSDDDARRLDPVSRAAYRPDNYNDLPADVRAAWDAAHADLVTADLSARNADVRVDRARARSRTTAAHTAMVNEIAEAAYTRRWEAYLVVERIEAGWTPRTARADRFVDDITEFGVEGVRIVRPEDQVDPGEPGGSWARRSLGGE